MARTSIQSLITEATTDFADNTTQLITPAKLRTWAQNFLDTMAPAYGAIRLTGPTGIALSAVAAIVAPFTTITAQSAEMVCNLVNGTVQRVLGTVPGATVRLSVNGTVAGANNALVTLALYNNAVLTPFSVTVICGGVSTPVSFDFTGFSYDTVSTTWDVRATSTNAGSFNFSNCIILCENVPVNAF